MDLVKEYNTARQVATKSFMFSEAITTILDRGWAISSDLEKGIGRNGVLVTGINPSYDGNPGEGKYNYSDAISYLDICEKKKGWHIKQQYWIRAKEVFGCPGELTSNIGFIDLFPIRCKEQSDFMRFDAEDKNFILKSNLLKVTQNAIEQMCPKIIIHANKTSGYYWGIDKHSPWMGYVTESVLDSKEDIPCEIRELWRPDIDIRIITDVSKDERCIWKGPSQLVDKKSYLVIYKQLGYQYIKNPREDRKVFERLFHLLGV